MFASLTIPPVAEGLKELCSIQYASFLCTLLTQLMLSVNGTGTFSTITRGMWEKKTLTVWGFSMFVV